MVKNSVDYFIFGTAALAAVGAGRSLVSRLCAGATPQTKTVNDAADGILINPNFVDSSGVREAADTAGGIALMRATELGSRLFSLLVPAESQAVVEGMCPAAMATPLLGLPAPAVAASTTPFGTAILNGFMSAVKAWIDAVKSAGTSAAEAVSGAAQSALDFVPSQYQVAAVALSALALYGLYRQVRPNPGVVQTNNNHNTVNINVVAPEGTQVSKTQDEKGDLAVTIEKDGDAELRILLAELIKQLKTANALNAAAAAA
ncbi:MAG: hypothetical protein WCF19_04905 [Chlamydiales bacterium]